jgi:hypothetical protein
MRVLTGLILGTLVLQLSATLRAGESKVNGSIVIAAGEHTGDVSTVNGSIELDAGAVAGGATTVNGNLTLRARAQAHALETVNGSVQLENDAQVAGGVELVNGQVVLERGATVRGRVQNVNGSIRLLGAHAGSIETTSGHIEIGADSRVEGGVLVHPAQRGWFSWLHFGSSDSGADRTPKIVIGPRAVVKGTLEFQREVHLYVSDSASIGPVRGANAVRFSGERPPAS